MSTGKVVRRLSGGENFNREKMVYISGFVRYIGFEAGKDARRNARISINRFLIYRHIRTDKDEAPIGMICERAGHGLKRWKTVV